MDTSMMRVRAGAVLAAFLSLLIVAAGPRTLSVRKPAGGRHHDSRRPKAPRHVLPSVSREPAESARRARPVSPRAADGDREESGFAPAASGRMPVLAACAMTKPDYLQSFQDPQRQQSPPS
jgi:hypothetical protein